jgi:Ca2+-binding RTX toxin-like protein
MVNENDWGGLANAVGTGLSATGHTNIGNPISRASSYGDLVNFCDNPTAQNAGSILAGSLGAPVTGAIYGGLTKMSLGPLSNTWHGKAAIVGAAILGAGVGAMAAGDSALADDIADALGGYGKPSIPLQKMQEACRFLQGSPLVIDLNKSGALDLTPLTDQSFSFFDLDDDGFAEHTGWVQPVDALLVRDVNANSIVDGIDELFGSMDEDGFVFLGQLDSTVNGGNTDSKISSADAAWNSLRVWRDLDSDGYSDPDELETLNGAGISSISLNYTNMNATNQGHHVSSQSTITFTDTSTATIQDVWFNMNQASSYWMMPSDFEYNHAVFSLPVLRGSGNVADLWVALTEDSSLLNLVEDLVAADYTELSFSAFRNDVENILIKWAGVEDVNPTSRGAYIDARVVEAVEEFVGDEALLNGSPILLSNASAQIEGVWNSFVDYMAVNLMSQIATLPLMKAMVDAIDLLGSQPDPENLTDEQAYDLLSPLFHDADLASFNHPLYKFNFLSYDYITNAVTGDFTSLINMLVANEPASSGDQQNYWQDLLPMINAVADSEQLTDAQYIAALNDTYLDSITADDLSTLRTGNVLIGTGGDDTLAGTDAADYIVGGIGNDRLEGKSGDDIYGYYVGDGDDTISDTGTTGDKLLFGPGITQADLSFARSGNDLLITRSAGGSVLIERQFNNGNDEIETIQFDNGDTISASALQQILLGTTSGNDTIVGFNDSDTITGGLGDDSMNGVGGNDTYIINQGDGADTIGDTSGSGDTVQFGSGITWLGTTMTQSGDNLIMGLAGGGSLQLVNQFNHSTARIENFVFADGSKSWQEVQDRMLQAKQTSGNDTIVGYAESDTITGGLGNDSMNGAGSNDTYIINQGQGADTIGDTSGSGDTVQFGSGITWLGTTMTQSGDNLIMGLAGGGSLQLVNQFNHSTARIENFIFADGTKTWQEVQDRMLQAKQTSGNDTIVGFSEADTITGGLGNDSMNGAGGNDTYIINQGHGADTIGDTSGSGDTVQFGSGITWLGTTMTQSGDNLIMGLAGGGSLQLVNQFNHSTARIENFIFADGKSWQEVQDRMLQAKQTSGNDTIVGFSEADTITGGLGNDSMNGAGGNDTYIINQGHGADTIGDTSGSGDTVQFGSGITWLGTTMTQSGDNLIMGLAGGGSLQLINQFNHSTARIENFIFADGTKSWQDIEARLVGGASAGDDTLDGTANADTIDGLGGNDSISGLDGADSLIGGDGNDTVKGGNGNDTLLGGLGADALTGDAGVDIFRFTSRSESPAPAAGQYDTVNQFKPVSDGDRIDLSELGFSDIRQGYGVGSILGWEQESNKKINLFGDGFYLKINYPTDVTGFDISQLLGVGSGYTPTWSGTLGADSQVGGTSPDSPDVLVGMGGNDTLDGNSGDDVLDGGAGADVLRGKNGADIYFYDELSDSRGATTDFISNWDSGDRIDVRFLGFTDSIQSAVTSGSVLGVKEAFGDTFIFDSGNFSIRIDGTGLNITDSNFIFASGPGFSDVNYAGTSSDDSYISGQGNDTLTGNGGNDSLTGGIGLDKIYGGAGNDTLTGGIGDDKLYGEGDNDKLFGGYGNDTLDGGDLTDSLDGGEGDDLLVGGLRNDTLVGGNGADIFRYNSASHSSTSYADIITDFTHGVDQIDISSLAQKYTSLVATSTPTGAQLGYYNDGAGHTIITGAQESGFKIILNGAPTVDVNDFVF